MASITENRNKQGKVISYRVRVFKGTNSYGQKQMEQVTIKVKQGMTVREAKQAAEKLAVEFEERYHAGICGDDHQTFAEYAERFVSDKGIAGRKLSTIWWYKEQLKRVNSGIGHLQLRDITPQVIKSLYSQLSAESIRINDKCKAKPCFHKLLEERQMSSPQLAKASGISSTTIRGLRKGDNVKIVTAENICNALGIEKSVYFEDIVNNKPLSQNSIHECRIAKHTKTNQEYHFNYYTFKFEFESELAKKLLSNALYPDKKKELSPQVCDLIVAAKIYIDGI